ncbi:hypothetical protein NMY22_g19832 [Coprinellus aureogranulatus]|nr:hypothetical protein NMY22_g19832 [Coprinellus aureogranulatus]
MSTAPVSQKPPTETYKHGHSQHTVNAHAGRTIYTSAAFLIPHIKPGMKILDVGCGPGTITRGFAELVGADGRVVGMDMAEKVISVARQNAAQKGLNNLEFLVADGGKMPFEDGTFDVVFCHAVLVHAPDPIGLLAEMRRVCKIGGIVAARDKRWRRFGSWKK